MGKDRIPPDTSSPSTSHHHTEGRRRHRDANADHQGFKKWKKQRKQYVSSSSASHGRHFDQSNKRNQSTMSSQRYHKKKRKSRQETKSVEDTSSDACSKSQTSQAPQIPGFYYDPDKKKYFKILSSNNNVNVVTKEKIERDQAEKQRLKDLSELVSSNQTKHNSNLPKLTSNFVHILCRNERGDIGRMQLENGLVMSDIRSLKPAGSWVVFDAPHGVHEALEHMIMMDTSKDKDKILGLWSVKETVMQRLQLLHLEEKQRMDTSATLSVSVGATGTTVLQSWNKISNVCWAPFIKSPDRNHVLYTTICHTGNSVSLAFIRNLDRTRRQEEYFDFDLGSRATWTCAWNYPRQQFSVGSEKCSLLVDVETRRMWEFPCSSDPFAQIFSPSSGRILYSGGRNGAILCHDLRNLPTRPNSYLGHKTSISSLRISSSENELFSSDISGRVKMWDVRMQRAVIEYSGLFNRYSRIPLHLDETEQVLYGAGQDCYMRFWSVKTGQLMRTVPPPCPVTRETIPAVQYSTQWANRKGNSGLILGIGDKLYYYCRSI
ncbi:DDB1- and CUL4-associated factor 4-like [Haliotis asinina]|uniref:DDB1- and CUL4-associated factor 4-like n=1 Tax=Haliotis asinina TaxID=109174 RepID=UPI0035327950